MASTRNKSRAYFKKASRVLVGGVNSPVRAFKNVGGTPVIVKKGKGCRFTDIDGRSYIDYVLSWGPLILGHADPAVLKAVTRAAAKGTSFGACHEGELELAELVRKAVPSMEMLRMVSSGTEATLSALRLARAATRRDLVLKFEGCYHGHADAFLVKAGSGAATMGVPSSPGIPAKTSAATLTLPYNDIEGVKKLFKKKGRQIAAVIVEPVAGNMGLVLPVEGFLETLRTLTRRWDSVLIFDEVMTGFRVAPGGAQQAYGIKPDLTTLGKVVGGGFPAAVFGGRRDLMMKLAPEGEVYQAGTLSGNPVAVAAGIATLKKVAMPGFFKKLSATTEKLVLGLAEVFVEHQVPAQLAYMGSMFGYFFSSSPVNNFTDAKASDQVFFRRWFHAMLEQGVYLAPSSFEAGFLSSCHRPADIEKTIMAARRAVEIAKGK